MAFKIGSTISTTQVIGFSNLKAQYQLI